MRQFVCADCGADQEYSKGGTLPRKCPECRDDNRRRYHREYYENNRDKWGYDPEKHAAMSSEQRTERLHQNRLRRTYSMSVEDYQELLVRQGGRCAICAAVPGERALNVDHDHACCPGTRSCGSCIRGLLCFSCNVGIGHLKDSVANLLAAADYLRGCE